MQLKAPLVRISIFTINHFCLTYYCFKTTIGAFVLAFGVRGSVNFCLYLIRVVRGKYVFLFYKLWVTA